MNISFTDYHPFLITPLFLPMNVSVRLKYVIQNDE